MRTSLREVSRLGLLAVAGALLTSCGTAARFTNAVLGTDPSPPPLESYTNSEPQTPADAMSLLSKVRATYSTRETEASQLGTAELVPLAVGAVAAIGAAFFVKGPAQANSLKGIGLGTGLWSALNYIYAPADRESAYRRGMTTLSCISEKALPLVAAHKNVPTGHQNAAIESIEQAQRSIVNADAKSADMHGPLSNSPQDVADFQALTQARSAATAAMAVAESERNAYYNATTIIIDAIHGTDEHVRALLAPKSADLSKFTQIVNQAVSQTATVERQNTVAAAGEAAATRASATAEVMREGRARSPRQASIRDVTDQYTNAVNTINTHTGLATAQAAVTACVAAF